MMTAATDRPGLRPGVRLVHDCVRGRSALLYPEGVLLLNDTAAAVLRCCDGVHDVDAVVASLARDYAGLRLGDVTALLEDLVARRLVSMDGTGRPADRAVPTSPSTATVRMPAPLGLVAELTYRCPLHCTYCANPLNLSDYTAELTTADWISVLGQARRIGVLQVHLSGGEPLLRRDLPQIVDEARQLGMYTNLITSGVPLNRARLQALVDAGLDHFQLSIQDSGPTGADAIAGRQVHDRKLDVAHMVKELGLPLTINVVLHRSNVDHLADLVDLAAQVGADRLELAHTQFYGWAWRNRQALMPTKEQVTAAAQAAAAATARHGERMEIVYVAADYYDSRPKPCMNGWGNRQLIIAPNGAVLPCLAAGQLPGPPAPHVTGENLDDIWYGSELFNRFRGTAWMPEPCRSCDLREIDFGGCRCQAYQLTGDSTVTDPACGLSPHHDLVADLVAPRTPEAAAHRRLR
jgi:pyrroloquinoline quinone biosynthesis protein E